MARVKRVGDAKMGALGASARGVEVLQVSGIRYQVSGIRYQVWYQVWGVLLGDLEMRILTSLAMVRVLASEPKPRARMS
jgi:hypothetical protein